MGKEKFTIARIFGAYYELYSKSLGYQRAVLKGKLRLQAHEDRHPFVVGDQVWADSAGSGDSYVILEKEPRKSFLTRKSDKGDSHVLAANLDQVAILASCKDPETKEGFIDRLLATVYPAGIQPLLLFTKKDLIGSDELKEKTSTYQKLGYKVKSVSLQDPASLQDLEEAFAGKVTFLCGNSGVGKSSLLNFFTREASQSVNSVSESTKKGKHTTTNSFAVFLKNDTVLIDSPGVKEWGILHLTKEEIFFSFPELSHKQKECKFSYCCDFGTDCLAMNFFNDEMEEVRRKSLESMLESLNKPHRTTRRDHWSSSVTERHPHRK